tara:strand:+ start:619 stop:849 length:231 start_codon:yes stop_codon:yes gene_type:complete
MAAMSQEVAEKINRTNVIQLSNLVINLQTIVAKQLTQLNFVTQECALLKQRIAALETRESEASVPPRETGLHINMV